MALALPANEHGIPRAGWMMAALRRGVFTTFCVIGSQIGPAECSLCPMTQVGRSRPRPCPPSHCHGILDDWSVDVTVSMAVPFFFFLVAIYRSGGIVKTCYRRFWHVQGSRVAVPKKSLTHPLEG